MDLTELYEKYPFKDIGYAQDLTGMTFGKWKVLYRTNSQGRRSYWVCQCSCNLHTIKAVTTKSLLSGKSKSCGCFKKERISKNADIKIHKKDEQGNILSKRCSCCYEWKSLDSFYKNTCTRDGYSGVCKNCENVQEYYRYNRYKKSAKYRNLPFDITRTEFNKITSEPCYYCGILEKYNGIDRVDSNKGYIKSNIVPCCEYCNRMKLDYSMNFWFEHLRKIIEYNKEYFK